MPRGDAGRATPSPTLLRLLEQAPRQLVRFIKHRSGLFDARARFSSKGLARFIQRRSTAFLRGLLVGAGVHVLAVALSGIIAPFNRLLTGLLVPFAHPQLGLLSFMTFPMAALLWTVVMVFVTYYIQTTRRRRLARGMPALALAPLLLLLAAPSPLRLAEAEAPVAYSWVADPSPQERPSDQALEGDINADFRPQGGMGWLDWLLFLLKNAPWLIPQSLLMGLLGGLINALNQGAAEGEKRPGGFRPPGGLPEDIPEQKDPGSKHPECDALYARLKDAINRYRKAQQARDEVNKRLDRAYLIHLHNQLVTAWKLGIDVGSLAGGGVDGIRMAGQNLGREAADLVEDIRRQRESLPGYAAERLRSRLAQIDASLSRLAAAQTAFDTLQAQRDALVKQLWAKWLQKHPGIPKDSIHPFAMPKGMQRPRSQHEIDLIELETNPIARQSILDDIARQGYATPEQRAALDRLDEAAELAQNNHLQREIQAAADGWDPDFDTFVRNQDPQLHARWEQIEQQLDRARGELRAAELDAPPSLVAERDRLRGQLEKIQHSAENMDTNPGTGRGRRPSDTGQATGAAAKPPSPREPKTKFWDVPKPPQWIRNVRDKITGAVGQLLSPVGRLWRWAFVGEDQSPEEMGRILQEGMDTINRLTAEFEAKQAEIDRIRAEVEHMREGLERCNKAWR